MLSKENRHSIRQLQYYNCSIKEIKDKPVTDDNQLIMKQWLWNFPSHCFSFYILIFLNLFCKIIDNNLNFVLI